MHYIMIIKKDLKDVAVVWKGTFGEVEGEGRLVGSKIVDMKDELIGQVLFTPPNHPTYASIHKPVLVAANINAFHKWQAEVPLQLWVKKGCNKATTCCIYMDWSIPSTKT